MTSRGAEQFLCGGGEGLISINLLDVHYMGEEEINNFSRPNIFPSFVIF